jgi:hypothetical protein
MLSIGQLVVLVCFCAAFGVMLANQHSRYGDLFICTIVAIAALQLSYLAGLIIVG